MTTDKPTGAVAAGLSAPALGGIFEAVSGLRNRRAIVALLGCLVGGVLLGGLLLFAASIAGSLFSLLAFLIYAVAVAVGVNAAGLLQMDEARGLPPRPLADALAGGLICLPKLIVLGLAMFAVSVGVLLVVALLLLLCKIPLLGPLLYVVVFPVSVVVSGFTLWATMLCLALALPAIWQGASLGQALTQTLAIARGRLVEGLLLLLALGVLCFGVSLVVFGVLGVGMGPTLALSASLLGIGGTGGMTSMLGGAGGGIAVAALVGASLLWAVAVSLVGQVYLRGLSIVYLRLTQSGLDVASAGAAWRSSVDVVRGRSGTPEHDSADRAPSSPPMKAFDATAAAATAVASVPPASFEAMQSAAFGGAPVSPVARNETSLPRPLAPLPPPAAAPDIDLGFDATAPVLDLSREFARTSDLDLPLASAAPATVDLLFDDTVAPPASTPPSTPLPAPAFTPPPAPPVDAAAATSVTSVDLAFDDLVALAPAPVPAPAAAPEIDEVTRIGASASGSPAAALPPVRAPEQLFVEAPAQVPERPSTQPLARPFVLAPAQPPAQPGAQPLVQPPASPPVNPPTARPSYAAPPAWTPPPTAATAPAPKPPPLLTACPQCLAAVASNDVFCGVCGYRLK